MSTLTSILLRNIFCDESSCEMRKSPLHKNKDSSHCNQCLYLLTCTIQYCKMNFLHDDVKKTNLAFLSHLRYEGTSGMKHHHCRLSAEILGGGGGDSVALEPKWLYHSFILQNNIFATGGVRYTRENWIPCLKITLEGCPYELGPYNVDELYYPSSSLS